MLLTAAYRLRRWLTRGRRDSWISYPPTLCAASCGVPSGPALT